jgi:hypothetical protein
MPGGYSVGISLFRCLQLGDGYGAYACFGSERVTVESSAECRQGRCHIGISKRRVGWERTGGWAYRQVRTLSSWIREVMSSLVKTLLRWYSAVRALM